MIFHGNIKKIAKGNSDFRRVLATGKHGQLVVMNLRPGEEIGSEVHPSTDQILLVVKGEGEAVVNGKTTRIEENGLVFVPAGSKHNLINTQDNEEMKVVTVYSPPEHADGTIHRSREDAMAAEEAAAR